jgi:hypothetical protein
MIDQESYIEFTTMIGNGKGGPCIVKCLRYCPQELIVSQYKGEKILSLEMFKSLMRTVPVGMPVFFSGRSEPFQNQQTIDMIEWAHARGNPVTIFSTCTGLKPDDARRLVKIPLDKFVLHLPDAYGNAKIPQTQDYFETRSIIETNVKHLEYMNMGWKFASNQCEGMARENTPVRKKGRRACFFLEKPGYQVQPNGEVSFCCMVRGLTEIVGNLNENTYPELAARHAEISERLATDPRSICHRCLIGEKYWLWKLTEFKNKTFGGRSIMQALSGGLLEDK